MAGYKLSASILNRRKTPGKMTDGLALSFRRNKDGSLTAWQRVKREGKESDEKVATLTGDVTQDWLQDVRARAYALRGLGAGQSSNQVTFEVAWEDFYRAVTGAKNSKWSAATAVQAKARMLNHIAGSGLWSMPIQEIRSVDVEQALATVRSVRPKLAPKVLQLVGQVLSYASHDIKLEANAAKMLREKLKASEKPVRTEKLPAITDWAGLGDLLHRIETSALYPTTRWALLLQAYTAQRSGEIALAKWEEFDLDAGTWTIPRARMKTSDIEKKPYDQRLILPAVAVELLRKIPRDSDWLFPPRHGESDCITVEAFSQAFQRLGFRRVATPHGWRSALKTLANDAADEDGRPLFSERWVEDVLDHGVQGVQAHYTRAQAEKGMAKVLAWWGERLGQAVTQHRARPQLGK